MFFCVILIRLTNTNQQIVLEMKNKNQQSDFNLKVKCGSDEDFDKPVGTEQTQTLFRGISAQKIEQKGVWSEVYESKICNHL